jgi:hypothetical protein
MQVRGGMAECMVRSRPLPHPACGVDRGGMAECMVRSRPLPRSATITPTCLCCQEPLPCEWEAGSNIRTISRWHPLLAIAPKAQHAGVSTHKEESALQGHALKAVVWIRYPRVCVCEIERDRERESTCRVMYWKPWFGSGIRGSAFCRSARGMFAFSVWTEFTVVTVRGSEHPRGIPLVTRITALQAEQRSEPQ